MSRAAFAVVFDHTALVALGLGNQMLSQLVSDAHAKGTRLVYTPALCLAGAVAQRPGLADHIGLLPSVEVIELDYAGAAAVGGFVAVGVDWRAAQAITVGRPTPDWPDGRPVLSTAPAAYRGWGIRVVPITGIRPEA